MEWSKIKNIIILILALLNAFLLVLVVSREGRSARYQEEALTQAVAVLEKNGIAFLPERVTRELDLPAWEVERGRIGETEDAMAAALLGDADRQTQGGDIQVTYTSPKGSAEFYSSGRFRFTLEPGVLPLGGEEPERHAARWLKQLSFDGTLIGITDSKDGTVLTFRQSWEGSPIFSCEAAFTYVDGSLRSIEGQRLSGAAAPAQSQPLLNTATILIRFLAGVNDGAVSVCTEIREMTPGYQASLARPVSTLSPVWRIVTDTGVYLLDGATGQITPSS